MPSTIQQICAVHFIENIFLYIHILYIHIEQLLCDDRLQHLLDIPLLHLHLKSTARPG